MNHGMRTRGRDDGATDRPTDRRASTTIARDDVAR